MLKLDNFYFIATKDFIKDAPELNLCEGEILNKDEFDNLLKKTNSTVATFSELLYRCLMALIKKDEEFTLLIDNFNWTDFEPDEIIELYENFPHEHWAEIK